MATTVDDLLSAALQLPEAERAELAELLAATTDAPPTRLHPAWSAEIRRRAAELDSGQVTAIPLEEALRQVRERLHGGCAANG